MPTLWRQIVSIFFNLVLIDTVATKYEGMSDAIGNYKDVKGRDYRTGQAVYIPPALWRNIPKCVVDGCSILFDYKSKNDEKWKKIDHEFKVI